MLGRIMMINSVVVATRAIIILTATAKVTTGHAEPKVTGKLAFITMGKGFSSDFLCASLIQIFSMHAVL
jgi:hypothetical protein